MSATALLVADAGRDDGLGHLSRLSAIAIALRCRGIDSRCFAHDAPAAVEREGVAWIPWSTADSLPTDVDVALLDSYRLAPAAVVPTDVPVVVFPDDGDVPAGSSLAISVAAAPSDDPRRLSGPRYAALTSSYWGLPLKEANGPLRRVLVTTGGGDTGDSGASIARAVAVGLPGVDVTLVRGRGAPAVEVTGVRVLTAPDSLFQEQVAADLVICGGGQTMLETAACGTPCLVLVLAENQREQVRRLASAGAVALVDPPELEAVVAAVRDLGSDARLHLGRSAQRAVDGYGALRIAFHVDALVRGMA